MFFGQGEAVPKPVFILALPDHWAMQCMETYPLISYTPSVFFTPDHRLILSHCRDLGTGRMEKKSPEFQECKALPASDISVSGVSSLVISAMPKEMVTDGRGTSFVATT